MALKRAGRNWDKSLDNWAFCNTPPSQLIFYRWGGCSPSQSSSAMIPHQLESYSNASVLVSISLLQCFHVNHLCLNLCLSLHTFYAMLQEWRCDVFPLCWVVGYRKFGSAFLKYYVNTQATAIVERVFCSWYMVLNKHLNFGHIIPNEFSTSRLALDNR